MNSSIITIGGLNRHYNSFGQYMKSLFGFPVHKVNVDAGFTCPNRDGSISVGGCIYCNNASFRPAALERGRPVREQVAQGIPYLRTRYGAERFLVYFQTYTNTYAPVDVLERLYLEALDHPGVIGLAIGTRPDCVDKEKIELLESLARKHFILVEYGLQSIYDKTLRYVNRGHDYACFKDALRLTVGRGIRIGAHIILGFPTETRQEMLAMADEISGLAVEFLKIHQLQIIKGTVLEEIYARDPFHTLGYEEYIELVSDFLERLSPDIVIQRLFASSPSEILVAPVWERSRSHFLRDLDIYMEKRDARQGNKYSPRTMMVSK